MSQREIVVIAGDGIGREIIPLAVKVLRAVRPDIQCIDVEAGSSHGRRTGRVIDAGTSERILEAGSALMGPEEESTAAGSATAQLVQSLDLYAALYPVRHAARSVNVLLVTEVATDIGRGAKGSGVELTPYEAWSASRLGNLAALLARWGYDRVIIAHDSEEAFAHAVVGGVGEMVPVERLDSIYLVNHLNSVVGELDLVVSSARTGRFLLRHLANHIQPLPTMGRLLMGPTAVLAMPAHGPLPDLAEWGFANPLGAIQAVVALLRYNWLDEVAASRIEAAIERALVRRRTPDMGGLHTMYEVTRAILQEL